VVDAHDPVMKIFKRGSGEAGRKKPPPRSADPEL